MLRLRSLGSGRGNPPLPNIYTEGYPIPNKIRSKKQNTSPQSLSLHATFLKTDATKPQVVFPSRFFYNKSKLLIFKFLQELLVMQQNQSILE